MLILLPILSWVVTGMLFAAASCAGAMLWRRDRFISVSPDLTT
jgi:membrane protein implicated in regulation of membrane protease activity